MERIANLIKTAKAPAVITVLLLMIPLAATQFGSEVVWDVTDFIVAAVLLFGTGFSYKMVTMQSKHIVYRVAVAIALVAGLVLIWSNLAVGIIGSENNAANLMYFGVVFILITGSFLVRFKSKGMAAVLFLTAAAQAITIFVALTGGMQYYPHSSVYEIILVNGFFIMWFLISGGLFWLIAGDRSGIDAKASAGG